MNDFGIPKVWGGRTVWNSEGKGGLSIFEFPKARGGLDEDAARGRVWIFSGITQFAFIKTGLHCVFSGVLNAFVKHARFNE